MITPTLNIAGGLYVAMSKDDSIPTVMCDICPVETPKRLIILCPWRAYSLLMEENQAETNGEKLRNEEQKVTNEERRKRKGRPVLKRRRFVQEKT